MERAGKGGGGYGEEMMGRMLHTSGLYLDGRSCSERTGRMPGLNGYTFHHRWDIGQKVNFVD